MMMMVQVLRIVVVSVLPPIVELLELGTCGHLVSLLLDVLANLLGILILRVRAQVLMAT